MRQRIKGWKEEKKMSESVNIKKKSGADEWRREGGGGK